MRKLKYLIVAGLVTVVAANDPMLEPGAELPAQIQLEAAIEYTDETRRAQVFERRRLSKT